MRSGITRAPEHPAHVWEAHRQQFTQLYRDEKRKLAEVAQIMHTRYRFHATERQYKRKIKQWKLEKHARAAEKERVLISVTSRTGRLEKDCIYKISGKDIAYHKLRRYARESGFKANENDASSIQVYSQSELPSLAFLPREKFGDLVFVDMYELAAKITCLLWFETWVDINNAPQARYIDTVPTSAFQRWTTNVLSTTQLSITHILIATLYIYRLKMINPSVTGRAGSEYRLLTVALMLANKYLDDNTYTNKTWAEVSGISIKEMHVMEIEFLTNMRYSLMVREGEMQDWIKQVGELQRYIHDTTSISYDRPKFVPMPGVPSDPEMSGQPSKESGPPSAQITPEIPRPGHSTIDLSSQSNQQANAVLSQTACESSWMEPLKETAIRSAPQPTDLDLAACDVTNTAQESIGVEDLQVLDAILIDTSPFKFSDVQPLPSVLTMEHRAPDWDPQDIWLQWENVFNTEVQDGPIPDLENWLDSSLWEESETPSGLTWQSVPLIEDANPDAIQSIVDMESQEMKDA